MAVSSGESSPKPPESLCEAFNFIDRFLVQLFSATIDDMIIMIIMGSYCHTAINIIVW